MDKCPDSSSVIARTIELLGGPLKARATIDAEFGSMTKRWNQDVESIGRILRSHLYLEHYLTEHLEKVNSQLGPVSKAHLSFTQKVDLLDSRSPRLAEILPGIRHLNKVRNRLAHQLTAIVTQDDAEIFLQAKLFKALRAEIAKPEKPSDDPLDILEYFAQYASSWLVDSFSVFGTAYGRALSECFADTAS